MRPMKFLPAAFVTCGLALASPQEEEGENGGSPAVAAEDLEASLRLSGLEFTAEEMEAMLGAALWRLRGYDELRAVPLDNGDLPAVTFSPLMPGVPERALLEEGVELVLPEVERPADLEDLAFADVATLASLVRSRKVSCVELTELFLGRLERHDPTLHCVITALPERARERARALDAELAEGSWRGPLHGIPWGAKDLLATAGAPTTWGAAPYREQVLDLDATVVQRLDQAGAVLVAKLTLGSLAMGDVWFGETTRNPWNPEVGSSGSSAGSASAVTAGLVPFAIGSETLGSIVSPSVRCGASSLRPTFGRISRHGAMTLCWSLDKLGPMARSAADCALVLSAIHGPDGLDPSVIERPFAWPVASPLEGMRVGYPRGAFGETPLEEPTLAELAELGVELVEVEIPDYPGAVLSLVLAVEAATAFDEFTRSDLDDDLVRQSPDAWPNFFRSARPITAVEFLRAQRARVHLMREFGEVFSGVDALVHPPFAAGLLGLTNLTGHPTFVCPAALPEEGQAPSSVCFTGHLFDESRLLALVAAWQAATPYEDVHPERYQPGGEGQ